jgi:hypothetical protein
MADCCRQGRLGKPQHGFAADNHIGNGFPRAVVEIGRLSICPCGLPIVRLGTAERAGATRAYRRRFERVASARRWRLKDQIGELSCCSSVEVSQPLPWKSPSGSRSCPPLFLLGRPGAVGEACPRRSLAYLQPATASVLRVRVAAGVRANRRSSSKLCDVEWGIVDQGRGLFALLQTA